MTNDTTDLYSHLYGENFEVSHTATGIHLNHVGVNGVQTRLTLPMDILTGLTRSFVRAGMAQDLGVPARLEELRAVIHDECISYGELAELQDLAPFIEEGDVELLEWAGVPEFPEDEAAWDLDNEGEG